MTSLRDLEVGDSVVVQPQRSRRMQEFAASQTARVEVTA